MAFIAYRHTNIAIGILFREAQGPAQGKMQEPQIARPQPLEHAQA
ncbi:hypothetical protein ABID08_006756 [Rhizobium binae]|uniref:Integrase n=1 Tax=Rhizobium binae TaxID=1138190 RepID=A0ABV2MSC1_9HYPH